MLEGRRMMQSGLIQMTAHMIRRPEAYHMIVAGISIAALSLFLMLCATISSQEHKRRYLLGFLAAAIIGATIAIIGANQPRVKELHCCASGAISLEEVATRYDIKEIDGKLIILWER